MNIIKFVSVALWSMCMLFLSCKKENPSLNETPATVENFRMQFKRGAFGK